MENARAGSRISLEIDDESASFAMDSLPSKPVTLPPEFRSGAPVWGVVSVYGQCSGIRLVSVQPSNVVSTAIATATQAGTAAAAAAGGGSLPLTSLPAVTSSSSHTGRAEDLSAAAAATSAPQPLSAVVETAPVASESPLPASHIHRREKQEEQVLDADTLLLDVVACLAEVAVVAVKAPTQGGEPQLTLSDLAQSAESLALQLMAECVDELSALVDDVTTEKDWAMEASDSTVPVSVASETSSGSAGSIPLLWNLVRDAIGVRDKEGDEYKEEVDDDDDDDDDVDASIEGTDDDAFGIGQGTTDTKAPTRLPPGADASSTATKGTESAKKSPLCEGDRVVRGPDWKWGTQDGGGSGTVVRTEKSAPPSSRGWVSVRWDASSSAQGLTTANSYRAGADNCWDLEREKVAAAAAEAAAVRTSPANGLHPQHQHPLALSHDTKAWNCNGTGCEYRSGPTSAFNSLVRRYRCSYSCDYDLCGKCWDASMFPAGTGGSTSASLSGALSFSAAPAPAPTKGSSSFSVSMRGWRLKKGVSREYYTLPLPDASISAKAAEGSPPQVPLPISQALPGSIGQRHGLVPPRCVFFANQPQNKLSTPLDPKTSSLPAADEVVHYDGVPYWSLGLNQVPVDLAVPHQRSQLLGVVKLLPLSHLEPLSRSQVHRYAAMTQRVPRLPASSTPASVPASAAAATTSAAELSLSAAPKTSSTSNLLRSAPPFSAALVTIAQLLSSSSVPDDCDREQHEQERRSGGAVAMKEMSWAEAAFQALDYNGNGTIGVEDFDLTIRRNVSRERGDVGCVLVGDVRVRYMGSRATLWARCELFVVLSLYPF